MCGRHSWSQLGELNKKIPTVFLPRFARLFCLLSSRILQNNFGQNSSTQAFILRKTRDEMLCSTASNFVCLKRSFFGTQNAPGAGTKFRAVGSNKSFCDFFQRYPMTVFCKMSVLRSKYCLKFYITWERLKLSRWLSHSCPSFKAYLIKSRLFSEVKFSTFHSPGLAIFDSEKKMRWKGELEKFSLS